MSEQEQRQVFKDNLLRVINERGLTQIEIAEAIGVSPQTFNTWVNGKAIPRMNKMQALADYFGIPKSALIDKEQPASKTEQILSDPDMKELFSIAKKASPEERKQFIKIAKAIIGED